MLLYNVFVAGEQWLRISEEFVWIKDALPLRPSIDPSWNWTVEVQSCVIFTCQMGKKNK